MFLMLKYNIIEKAPSFSVHFETKMRNYIRNVYNLLTYLFGDKNTEKPK